MEPHIVAISAIEHYLYCPRQCALIHVDGIWDDNPHTIRGHRGHRRVDNPDNSRTEKDRKILRAVPLWSEQYGLTGRADVIEIYPDGRIVPVEYKVGVRHGDAADLQLCAQAICLEGMLDINISEGFVWYSGVRRRYLVIFTSQLRSKTLHVVNIIRSYIRSGILPQAPNDERCNSCQLLNHCLPEVVNFPRRIQTYIRQKVWDK